MATVIRESSSLNRGSDILCMVKEAISWLGCKPLGIQVIMAPDRADCTFGLTAPQPLNEISTLVESVFSEDTQVKDIVGVPGYYRVHLWVNLDLAAEA